MSDTCPCCGQKLKIGQVQLTEREKAMFNWGGPDDDVNIIKAQCVKAAAEYYGVSDWTSKWDTTLSVSENIERMRKEGSGITMREMQYQMR